jgi:hypothetical protein
MSLSEKQVCSLEYSRELEKLGVRQNSIFYWRKYSLCKNTDLYYIPNKEIDLLVLSGQLEYNLSAFTATELLERLPSKLPIKARATDFECDYSLSIYKLDDGKYEVCYAGLSDAGCYGNEIIIDTLTNALAKLLIYLLENKTITL